MRRKCQLGGIFPAILLGVSLILAAAAAHAFDADKADRSVVRVLVLELKNGQRTNQYITGTGFVVADEYVVTNEHVVDDSDFTKGGATSERVIVDGSLKKLLPAQLVWSSAELDLAVLKVPGLKRPVLTLSSAVPLQYPGKAAAVWAIGFPGLADRSIKSDTAFTHSTVTQGVVGKVVEGRAGQRDKVRPVIQHNASINKGNSGGPLFDDCGLVVGVNTFGAVSTMEVSRDQKGRDVAAGMPNTGIFYSPHISNLIDAQKTVPVLAAMKLTLSPAPCLHAVPIAEPAGLPIWVFGVIGLVSLLALTSLVVAFRKGTTREIVRVVESYSAYIRRQGDPPSKRVKAPERSRSPTAAPAARDATAALAAAASAGSKLVLAGRTKEQSFRVEITAAELENAARSNERGIVVGRSRALSDKVVDDPSVSRRHAKFFLADGVLMVEDMGSAYGVKVNGKPVPAHEAASLKPGDKLALGGITLDVGRG